MTHCYLDESQALTYFYSFLTRQLSLDYTSIYLSFSQQKKSKAHSIITARN